MKRLIISILVLVVIGVGFYYGYQQSHKVKFLSGVKNSNNIVIPSSIANQSIHFEYHVTSSPNRQNNLYTDIQYIPDSSGQISVVAKGYSTTLDGIINVVTGIRGRNLTIDPSLYGKYYQFSLTFPYNEDKIKILDMLGSELGFTYQYTESNVNKLIVKAK